MDFSYYVIPVPVTGISTSTGTTRGAIDTAAPAKADHGRGEQLA